MWRRLESTSPRNMSSSKSRSRSTLGERDEAEMEDMKMKHSEEVQRLKRQLSGAYDQSGRGDSRE